MHTRMRVFVFNITCIMGEPDRDAEAPGGLSWWPRCCRCFGTQAMNARRDEWPGRSGVCICACPPPYRAASVRRPAPGRTADASRAKRAGVPPRANVATTVPNPFRLPENSQRSPGDPKRSPGLNQRSAIETRDCSPACQQGFPALRAGTGTRDVEPHMRCTPQIASTKSIGYA